MKLFDITVGKFIRLCQRSLLVKSTNSKFYDLLEYNAIKDSVTYVLENMPNALYFDSKLRLRSYSVDLLPILKSEDGFILEFGVYKGTSINHFASLCPKSKIIGFDSFFGLEEDWAGHWPRKGWFNLNGSPPSVQKNVTLIQGLFEETLPEFLNKIDNKVIHLVHLDADTYKPTKFVLDQLIPKLKSDSIIIFDEFFGYPGWKLHEYKAWSEAVLAHNVSYEFIGYTEKQVAVRVL
jgi:hypothetical protein